ncbi:MAG: methyltetrahydrofolate cobalamin methyltransferase [Chloroflexota bacterium]|jgi:5-methyltetrahydrofolate--homocysteine methyltransferase
MKIIGEKINGTRKRVAKAIAERDEAYIKDLATKQTEAGAAWLDVNAGTRPEQEPDDLKWLIKNIQAVVDTPLSLDSANPAALQAAIQAVNKTPLINSISGEPERLKGILPLVAEHNCQVIALTMDEKRIPETSQRRIEVVRKIMAETRAHGIADDHVYLDPLALTIATNTQSGVVALETMRAVRHEFPKAHLTIGLSNISFGLPARSTINRGFLMLAMATGLDTAILDPLDREIQATILTAQLLLGQDEYCLNYVRAFRKGVFD